MERITAYNQTSEEKELHGIEKEEWESRQKNDIV